MTSKDRMQTKHFVFIAEDILGEQCLKLEWQNLKEKKKKIWQ